MIERLWSAIARIANGWVFLALLIVYVLCSYGFNRFHDVYKPAQGLDARGFYAPSAVPDILGEFGSNIGVYLRQESTLDLAFPIVYSLLFSVGIVWLGRKSAPHWLVALPFATALFDYCENACAIAMILRYRKTHDVSMAVAWIASLVTPVKTVLFVASSLIVVVLVVIRVYRYSAAVPSSTLLR